MNVHVCDPFGLDTDPALWMVEEALEPSLMQAHLERALPSRFKPLALRAVRVTRHKRGRRCLIEYDLDTSRGPLSVIGKVRAKGLDRRSYEVQTALWQRGFDSKSEDYVSVPEPLGVIETLHMTLQRKVSGVTATEALARASDTDIAERIAYAAYKLHRASVPTQHIRRCHTPADEVRILHEQLGKVIAEKPQWKEALSDILEASERLAKGLPDTPTTASTAISTPTKFWWTHRGLPSSTWTSTAAATLLWTSATSALTSLNKR